MTRPSLSLSRLSPATAIDPRTVITRHALIQRITGKLKVRRRQIFDYDDTGRIRTDVVALARSLGVLRPWEDVRGPR